MQGIHFLSLPSNAFQDSPLIEEAYRHYKHALESDPEDMETQFQLGEFLLCELEELEAAETELTKVLLRDCHAIRGTYFTGTTF